MLWRRALRVFFNSYSGWHGKYFEVSELPTTAILFTDYDEKGDAKEETKSLGEPISFSGL